MTLLLGAWLGALVFFMVPPGRLALLRAATIDQWRAIDRETDRGAQRPGETSTLVLAILVTAAVSLTIQEYFGDHRVFEELYGRQIGDEYYDLYSFVWWTGWRVGGYLLPPLLVLVLLGQPIGDYHLSARGFFRHLPIYVVLYLGVLPLVIAASHTPAFRETYPFYRLANRSQLDLWSWEAMYAMQFVALEIFFRGFLLHGLRRALGANAIFVMIVPYCMIHFQKPMAETFGAIIAGLVLGTLAMRTRSIWGGVAIHAAVALTMDVLALAGCPSIGSGHFCGE
jgi:membrane protease YdiL (CAAX protease family)